MKHIFTNLHDIRQRTFLLLFDEYYVKAKLHYHDGIAFGKAVNKLHLLTNTILSFMLVTFFGSSQFLHKTLPVQDLDSKLKQINLNLAYHWYNVFFVLFSLINKCNNFIISLWK